MVSWTMTSFMDWTQSKQTRQSGKFLKNYIGNTEKGMGIYRHAPWLKVISHVQSTA